MNDNGGIIDDLIITRTTKGFCIILNAACKDNDIKQISKYLSSEHKNYLNSDLTNKVMFPTCQLLIQLPIELKIELPMHCLLLAY